MTWYGWFLFAQLLLSIGAAIGLYMSGQKAWALTQFAYAIANIGWILGTIRP